MAIIKVKANLEAGMILKRAQRQNTVTDFLFVTAIGADGILALDTDGRELHEFDGAIQDYECFGHMSKAQDLHAYMDYMQDNQLVSHISSIAEKWTKTKVRNGTE